MIKKKGSMYYVYRRKNLIGKTKSLKKAKLIDKLPAVLSIVKKQKKVKGNRKADKKRQALPPGKRISKNGKIYYEYRSNRSDLNKKKGL